MKMTFWKLFLTCMFENPNLAEKSLSLAENLKKVEHRGFHGVFFSKSADIPSSNHHQAGSYYDTKSQKY